jgi:hypothetical protein
MELQYVQTGRGLTRADSELLVCNVSEKLSERNSCCCSYSHDFDENGLLYWMGTNGRTAVDWVNPAQYGLVVVTSSEGRNLPYGRLEDILSRDTGNGSILCSDIPYPKIQGIHHFSPDTSRVWKLPPPPPPSWVG